MNQRTELRLIRTDSLDKNTGGGNAGAHKRDDVESEVLSKGTEKIVFEGKDISDYKRDR